jgi:dynein heavy chain, axonemal
MMLIWKHSNFYAQPARVATLVRELCNSLIEKAMTAGEGLHQKEAQEAADALRMILRVLGTFKSFYYDYKARCAAPCTAAMARARASIYTCCCGLIGGGT